MAKVRLALNRVRNKRDNANDFERFECFVVGAVVIEASFEVVKDLIKRACPCRFVEVF